MFELIDKSAKGKKCPAIDGILEEGAEIMEEHERGAGLDAAMAALGQAVEHYEMARYGTLVNWGTELGLKDAVKLLAENLAQEEATEDALEQMATSELNPAANRADDQSDSNVAEMKSAQQKAPTKPKSKTAA